MICILAIKYLNFNRIKGAIGVLLGCAIISTISTGYIKETSLIALIFQFNYNLLLLYYTITTFSTPVRSIGTNLSIVVMACIWLLLNVIISNWILYSCIPLFVVALYVLKSTNNEMPDIVNEVWE